MLFSEWPLPRNILPASYFDDLDLDSDLDDDLLDKVEEIEKHHLQQKGDGCRKDDGTIDQYRLISFTIHTLWFNMT